MYPQQEQNHIILYQVCKPNITCKNSKNFSYYSDGINKFLGSLFTPFNSSYRDDKFGGWQEVGNLVGGKFLWGCSEAGFQPFDNL